MKKSTLVSAGGAPRRLTTGSETRKKDNKLNTTELCNLLWQQCPHQSVGRSAVKELLNKAHQRLGKSSDTPRLSRKCCYNAATKVEAKTSAVWWLLLQRALLAWCGYGGAMLKRVMLKRVGSVE